MGRRKYSFKGKPHGRNELIKVYLWIAYCQSLPPGAVPDPTMERTRKQVSSHIQVLKGFMRGHPACELMKYLTKMCVLIQYSRQAFPKQGQASQWFRGFLQERPLPLGSSSGQTPKQETAL